MKAYVLIMILAASIGAAYAHGKYQATEGIARSCAIENRFNAVGVMFMCIDEEDYFVEPK